MASPAARQAPTARGVVYVHSSPRALCPHVEWAAGRALGRAVNFSWVDQPVLKGAQRAEFYWEGDAGTGAAIASALHGWEHLRYEVTEDPGPGTDGARWMHTPDLGVFFAQTDSAGNMVVSEDRIRSAMENAGPERPRPAQRAAHRARTGLGRRTRRLPPRSRRRRRHLAAQGRLTRRPHELRSPALNTARGFCTATLRARGSDAVAAEATADARTL